MSETLKDLPRKDLTKSLTYYKKNPDGTYEPVWAEGGDEGLNVRIAGSAPGVSLGGSSVSGAQNIIELINVSAGSYIAQTTQASDIPLLLPSRLVQMTAEQQSGTDSALVYLWGANSQDTLDNQPRDETYNLIYKIEFDADGTQRILAGPAGVGMPRCFVEVANTTSPITVRVSA